MTVALVKRHDQTLEALRKAIQICGGFDGLKPGTKVVLKPNMVMRGYRTQPPDGVVTPVETMESMITLLREHGCNDITIADGGVIHPDLKLNTTSAYKWAGYVEMSERLEVPLVDLNEGPFVTVDLEGLPVKIAKLILDAEFLINLPVLKTHQQTMVSLGIKNLKGVIAYESKKDFHRTNLMRCIALLGKTIRVDLTIIDGTFGLQRGPTGDDVHRIDVLVAGKDIMHVDLVGSRLLGIDPALVDHLRIFAELGGRSLTLEDEEVIGEEIGNLVKPLEWSGTWTQDLLNQNNIKGISMEIPGPTCCSGCGFGIYVAISGFLSGNAGTDFGGVAICSGKEKIDNPDVRKVICLGKCACDTNSEHPNAVKIPGCPPSVKRMSERLAEELLS